jgi:hypothetical protein
MSDIPVDQLTESAAREELDRLTAELARHDAADWSPAPRAATAGPARM